MCDLFGSKTENTALKKDLKTIFNLSRYLANEVERPPKKEAVTLAAKDAIENLEWACDNGKYTPPAGMIYRCTGTDISNILKKYKLDDSWMRLDAVYHVPRWDYMQLLYLWDWIDQKQYVAEYFDCDDFGLSFKSHMAEYAGANGVMWVIDWSGGHSYNMVFDIQITNDDPQNPIVDVLQSKAIILEPQGDQWEYVPMVADEQGGTKVPEDYIPWVNKGNVPASELQADNVGGFMNKIIQVGLSLLATLLSPIGMTWMVLMKGQYAAARELSSDGGSKITWWEIRCLFIDSFRAMPDAIKDGLKKLFSK